ncbi:MAG: polysaccharide deacetylase family protein, partial [Candidatus Pacebacteria bacterium]|nr:polysaccharide deacetylase family protein [Candidatus Paceibacterota bacterium]
SNGELAYIYMGDVPASNVWNKYTTTVTMPADALTATVYVTIFSVGYLITDDYSMGVIPEPEPLNRAIVTLTYDESASTVYEYGFPLFKEYGAVGDIYILSEELRMGGMMSKQEFNALRGLGFEIGSHTITHPYMTQISEEQMISELRDSQSAISDFFDGIAVPDFASPYGEYNTAMIEEAKKYYQSHRTTDEGFNSKENFDPYRIKAFSIESDMSAEYVTNLIDQAIASNTWLVLVYHDIRPDDGSGFLWTTTPENMETVLAYLRDNDVAVMTTSQAISEIQGQIE